jgi:hypothetical protein
MARQTVRHGQATSGRDRYLDNLRNPFIKSCWVRDIGVTICEFSFFVALNLA